jgi:hypothetical protein
MGGSSAVETTLEEQDAFSTALPVGLRQWTGLRKRDIA